MASSSSLAPIFQNPLDSIKNVKFALGKGNKNVAKLVVVQKKDLRDEDLEAKGPMTTVRDKIRAPNYFREVLLCDEFLPITTPPKVLISVTGAAANFKWDPKVAQVFFKGLVRAAQSTTAWIVSGGTDVGIMHYVGEANRMFATDVTTIGFATYHKIHNKHLLKTNEKTIEYDATDTPQHGAVNLNPNHSHFVLVESDNTGWGEEIEMRSDFEEFLCTEYKVPGCLIVVGGGPGTLRTVAEGCGRKFSVVVFEGTGRAAELISHEIRRHRGEKLEPFDMKEEEKKQIVKIIAGQEYITLYNEKTGGPFDLEILKSIMRSSHGSLLSKLSLAIEWDREDLAEHILEAEAESPEKASQDELSMVLSKAMELSLYHERPKLFRLLVDKGAKKRDMELAKLYATDGILDPNIKRYEPHVGSGKKNKGQSRGLTVGIYNTLRSPLLRRRYNLVGHEQEEAPANTNLSEESVNFIGQIFGGVDVFDSYAKRIKQKLQPPDEKQKKRKSMSDSGTIGASLKIIKESLSGSSGIVKEKSVVLRGEEDTDAQERPKVTYTDCLLWAILMGRHELAKVIWEKTALPIHTALLASGLCKGVADWLLNEQESFNETAGWFEKVAIALLDKLEYPQAKMTLEYSSEEFDHTALELAVDTECKEFTAHRHVQRLLDGMLYTNRHGAILSGTWTTASVILCIFAPFLLYVTGTYSNDEENNPATPNQNRKSQGKWYHYYELPFTKFWTNTLCYFGYLILLAYVLIAEQANSKVSAAEGVLWVWMFGYAMEEISQFRTEGWSYLGYNSNRMDMFILLLQICYISLALTSRQNPTTALQQAATDFLIVCTIISWVRLMDVFTISKSLGPLYVILTKIIGDVFKWIFVFMVFAVGFQLSFMALNTQVQQSDSDSASSASSIPGPTVPTIDGGTFMGSFFTIIGDWDSTMEILKGTKFGAVVTALYALIAQIMLVNLLIAMMGDTFNSVQEDSDKEWKYSRYSLIVEYTSTSFHPPPTNVLVVPIKYIYKFLFYMFKGRKQAKVPQEPDTPELTIKQREQLLNLLKSAQEAYIVDREEEEKKTLSSVSADLRESFKVLLEEQDTKQKTLEHALADRFKNELSGLQETILNAIKNGPPAESSTITIHKADVRVSWANGITKDQAQKVLREYKPFSDWVENVNKSGIKVSEIHIQAVDTSAYGIESVKFTAQTGTETGSVITVGPSVAILIVLKLSEEGSAENGREFAIVAVQRRTPLGGTPLAEIPTGFISANGHFAGPTAQALKNVSGLDIKETEIIDLTRLAYNGAYHGVASNPHISDEFVRLFLHRVIVTREQLSGYTSRFAAGSESPNFRAIALDQILSETPDAKSLAALFLYSGLSARGLITL